MQPENGALVRAPSAVDVGAYFTTEQKDLIKRQIAKGVSDDELALFMFQCARTGLDPFSRQIYALERREMVGNNWVSKMSIMTGIDGLRLIAERTGRYSPGPETTYEYDSADNLRKATAFVLKRTPDGTWHTVAASAFYGEYVQTKKDGTPTKMWAEKPHIMLGKCAESLALRRAFPAEMSGLYTTEEMGVTGEVTYEPPKAAEPPKQTVSAFGPAPQPAPLHPSEVADEPASSDTGEAPSDADLDEFADALKSVKWTAQHVRNWCAKYFGTKTPEGFTKLQLRDAFSMVYAFAQSKETYAAKVKMLQEAGRINPEPPKTPPPSREPGEDG